MRAKVSAPDDNHQATLPLAAAVEATQETSVLDSEALFNGLQTVLIMHNGEIYRLQQTRAGKLILTK